MKIPVFLQLILLLFCTLLSVGFFFLTKNFVFAVLPFAGWLGFSLLTNLTFLRSEENLLLIYIFILFLVDDQASKAWIDVTTFTEILGLLLYKPVGINGTEAFGLFMTIWLFLTQSPKMKAYWYQNGLGAVWVLAVLVICVFTISAIYGMANGGTFFNLKKQYRFLHVVIWYCVVGFILVRNIDFAKKIIVIMTAGMIFKGYQGVFNYYLNIDYYLLEEYLITHFVSAFFVVGMGTTILIATWIVKNRLLKAFLYFSLIPMIMTFTFNDRRTSIVGAVFGVATIFAVQPIKKLLRFIKPVLIGACSISLYLAITWNMTGPLAFMSSTIKGFTEDQEEGLTSREMENFNLYSTVVMYPVIGIGLGRPYPEIMILPKIDHIYQLNQILPHNGLLWFWAYGGPMGMASIGTFIAFMIGALGRFFAETQDKFTMIWSVAGILFAVQWIVYIYGDMAYQTMSGMSMGGLFLGGSIRMLAELRRQRLKRRRQKLTS